MAVVLSLLFLFPFAACLMLSWHPALGRYRLTALNPLLLFSGYILLVGADYLSMGLTGFGVLADVHLSPSEGTLSVLQVRYIAMISAALFGFAFALFTSRHFGAASETSNASSKPNIRMFATTAYLLILGTWLFFLLQYTKNGLSLEDAAELRNASSWDSSLFLATLLLVPGLSYMLPRQSFRVVLPITLLSIALLLFSGSRTRILYVLIPVVFYLVAVRRWRLPRSLFVIGVLVLGFLALVALNFRVITSERQSVTWSDLATTSNIFNLNDVSFAETSVALSRLPRKAVEEYPGQSLIGFVLADIPRSVVPIKPFKGSDQFTQAYDPINWRLFKRGLTVGSINELQFDYPFPIALVLVFGFAMAWMWGFIRAAASRTIHGFVWTIGCYVMLYAFLKSDIQSAGQLLWAFVAYWLIIRAYSSFGGSTVPAAKIAIAAAPVRG